MNVFNKQDSQQPQVPLKATMWCRKFFYTGGFQHMLNMLLQDNELRAQKYSQAFKPCLRLILKIIYHFTRSKYISSY